MCISLQTASCSENCTAQYCESQWAAAVSGKKISWNFGLFCQEYCSSYFRKDIKNPWSHFSLKFVNKVWFYKVECSLGILPFWSVWDHCLIFTKIQFRVKGGEDRRRTCTVQETAFFFSKYRLYQNMLSYCTICPSHVAKNPFQHAC